MHEMTGLQRRSRAEQESREDGEKDIRGWNLEGWREGHKGRGDREKDIRGSEKL